MVISALVVVGAQVACAAPGRPVVTDDGVCTGAFPVSRLHAVWSAAVGAVRYEYAIGPTPNPPRAGFMRKWTDIGSATSVTAQGLRLHEGCTYYFYVRAVDANGERGEVGVSDGIIAGVGYKRENVDLLGGWGDMSYSGGVSWVSAYTGEDYWKTFTGWASKPNADGYRFGYAPVTKDDAVAVGWLRESGWSVNPGADIIFRIEPDGDAKTCQYMALRGEPKVPASVRLETPGEMPLPDDLPEGCSLEFRLDHIRLDSQSVSVKCYLAMSPVKGIRAIDAGEKSVAWEMTIPAGVKRVRPAIVLEASEPLRGRTPGVYISGAHLYIRDKRGDYLTEIIPVPRDRNIDTFIYNTDVARMGDRSLARDADTIVIKEDSKYWYTPRLKYLHPGVNVYRSQLAVGVVDDRENDLSAAPFHNGPIECGWALRNHPEWFYPPTKLGTAWNEANDVRPVNKRSNYAYQWAHTRGGECLIYAWKMGNAELQKLWANNAASGARLYRMDGVFVDSVDVIGALGATPNDVQSFTHTVAPIIRSYGNGLGTIANIDRRHATDGEGSLFFDPTVPSNTPENTWSTFYQQEGFWRRFDEGLKFDLTYWDACLKDMDYVVKLNASIARPELKKRIAMGIPDVFADKELTAETNILVPTQILGLDGSLHFAFCSYLLGCNEWTMLTITGETCEYMQDHKDHVSVDLSLTERLGDPTGPRESLTSDDSVQIRHFTNGLVIVNARPKKLVNSIEQNAYTFTPDRDLYEEATDRLIKAGSTFTLQPHTGRVLLYAE